ncbi:MAG TPA: cytochrome b [Caldimonas sp.]|jgi:cytochrome b561
MDNVPPVGSSAAMPWRYSGTAIALHWLLAILITLTTAIGWRMMWIEHEPGSEQFFELHKSIGLVIAALVAARVLWRLTHRPEPRPEGAAWESRLASASHALLYVLIVALPITGYLGASYSKAGVQWFGIATPRWTAPDHDTSELFFTAHGVLLWTLVPLVALHVAGALKHLLIDKDGTFWRMWFAPRR